VPLGSYGIKSAASILTDFESEGSIDEDLEWGRSEASFANGNRFAGRYLTVWYRELGHDWKIRKRVLAT